MKHPTNQQVVGGFNRKEKWAFEWIFFDCKASIYELAIKILKNKEDARDLTTDMFLKLQRLKERKSSIKGIRDLVYLSTKNLALDRLRKRQRDKTVKENYAKEQTLVTDADMERNETAAAICHEIDRCKTKLTPQCQRVFNLHFIEQKSIEEISKEMNIKEKTAHNDKSRALRVMRLEIVPRKSFVFLLTLLS